MRLFITCILFLTASHVTAQRLNRTELGLVPPKLNHCTEVKNQSMSSTCWSFSSVSLLESELLKIGKGESDLSEMFIARYSMLRKIHRHLKLRGGNFFTPGGQFHDAAWVIRNFGMVPEEAYPGKRGEAIFHDHSELDTVLSRFVRACVQKAVTELNLDQSRFVDSVLDHYMGPVPSHFNYKGRTWTAHSFRDQYLEMDMDDYVEISSYTHHPFYKKFVLEDKYNWTGDEYWNVPLSDLNLITQTALANGYTVGWDGDAQDENFSFMEGLAWLPGAPVNMTEKRQAAFKDQGTLLDHMMHIVGQVKDKKGRIWYYIKNSWGTSNPLGGFLFMRDDYFQVRTVAIIVNKNAIPPAIRMKMGL
jgi:bleomycin hydrolase